MVEKALLLGLSTGPFCLGFCLPVLFPLTCAAGRVTFRQRARTLAEFSLGRLLAYLAFGALVGFLGQRLTAPWSARIAGGAIICLALLLLGFGIMQTFPRLGICRHLECVLPAKRFPVLMGLCTGLNACPPFLLAVTYVFTLGDVGGGLAFFAVYFMVASLYIIPMLFVGDAAKHAPVRWIAQISSILAGAVFAWMGLVMLLTQR